MEFLKVLISSNQNRALPIRKFSSFLISINQNGAFTQNGVFHKIDIRQSESRIPSQLIFVVLTNLNEVFTDFKMFSDQKKNYFYKTSQSINFIEFSNINNIYI